MSDWKEIITTRKSSLAVGLARSICSTIYIQQGIEKSQQAVGGLSKSLVLGGYHEIFENKKPQINADKRRFVIAYLRSFAFICGFLDSKTKRFYIHAVDQLTQNQWGQNIKKNLPDEFRSSLPGIEEIEVELSGGRNCDE